MNGNKLIK